MAMSGVLSILHRPEYGAGPIDYHIDGRGESPPRPMAREQGVAMTQTVRRLSYRNTPGVPKIHGEKAFFQLFHVSKKRYMASKHL